MARTTDHGHPYVLVSTHPVRRRFTLARTRPGKTVKLELIRLRTREGMKVAKAKGRLRGKQPKLNRRKEAHLVSLVHSGEYSTAEVAELFGVGRSTVYCVPAYYRALPFGNGLPSWAGAGGVARWA